MTTYTLVQVINRAGWLCSECFQRDTDQWYVGLRQRGGYTVANGEGETMDEAFEKAWLIAQKYRHTSNAEWAELQKQPLRGSKPKIERPRRTIERPRRHE